MTFDTTINLPTVVSLVLAVIGFVIWLVRLENRTSDNTKDAREMSESFGALRALVLLHKEQFHEYQLQVAKDYVSNTVMAEIKRDIITELGRMEGRVETQIDRLIGASKG